MGDGERLPLRGPGGELEAVGRWVNPEGQAFCGWGLFRLTDGAVLRRVATEMLPTGRSCWVSGLPRTILFPAADGQLHRCRLDGEDEHSPAPSSWAARGAGHGDAVLWGIRPPGEGDVFLADPVWSDEPKLKKWVIVALSQKVRRGKRFVFGPPDLWWLEVSDGAGSIIAAGPLVRAEDGAGSDLEKRFPSVAVDPRGRTPPFLPGTIMAAGRLAAPIGRRGTRRPHGSPDGHRCGWPGIQPGRGTRHLAAAGLVRRGDGIRPVAIGRHRRLAGRRLRGHRAGNPAGSGGPVIGSAARPVQLAQPLHPIESRDALRAVAAHLVVRRPRMSCWSQTPVRGRNLSVRPGALPCFTS